MLFRYFTPIVYWILIVIWSYIFFFYLKKINRLEKKDKLLKLLLIILTIDAFRTLFESVYFGAWYTSLSGIIPIEIFNQLAKPEVVFFPKTINLIVAILILMMLIRKWLPSEILQKNEIDLQIETQISELLITNKKLKVANEISERKAIELKNQKMLFESMFNTITDGVVIANTNREIILANNGMKTTFGYEPKELIGKSAKILYYSDSSFHETGKKVYNKESQSLEKTYITYYKDKNNKMFPGETFGTKLFDTNNRWIGNLGIIRDISELQKMTQDKEKRAAELIIANKELAFQNQQKEKRADELLIANKELAFQNEQKEKRAAELLVINKELEQYEFANIELKQFAYIASHELKEPIRTIANYIQIINEDYSETLDKKTIEYLHTITKSVKRMGILINSLLQFSRLGLNKKISHVDCKELVDSVLSDLEILIKSANASIEVFEMPKLNVYEIEFRQVFQNLITNAIKFHKKRHSTQNTNPRRKNKQRL